MIEWCSTLQDYASSTGDAVPVLRPRRERDRSRWTEVLEELYVAKPSGPDGPERLVVACGLEPLPVAVQIARRTGSDLLEIESPEGLSRAVREAAQSNLLVLALAQDLRIRLVTEVVEAAAAEGRYLGFLSGRTVAGLSFSAAKALLPPRPDLAGIDDFAAPGHHLDHSAGSAGRLAARIKRPTLAKVIHAHGEGSHAKLPGVTVCGLLDEVEFPGAPQHGCSRLERRCKRAQRSGPQVVFGDELPAPVIGFVCCNGFNFAAELYPSPVALALALVEGYAAAVITAIRPLVVTDEIVVALNALLEAGTPIGEVTHRLNRLSAEIGQPTTFACHGDPCFALPSRRPVASRRRASDEGTARPESPPSGLLPTAPDAGVLDVQGWLVRVLRDLERGRRVLRSVDAWLDRSSEDLTGSASELLEKIERLAVYTLKRAEVQTRSASIQELRRATVPIRLLVSRWDKTVAQMLLSLRDKVDPFDIGHYDQLLVELRRDAPCARCRTPLEISTYGARLPATERRTAVLCTVCGPVREHRTGGIRLEVLEQTSSGTMDDELRVRIELSVPEEPLVSHVAVFVRFFDKARDRCIQEAASSVSAEHQMLDFRFPLPGDLSHDLHTIRLLAACGFDMAYSRIRFAFLPRTGALEAEGAACEADLVTGADGERGSWCGC